MPLLKIAFLAAVLMLAADGVGHAWENTPLLNIYQVAYPVVWNGKTIMIGARLQLPAGAKGKMPAVIMSTARAASGTAASTTPRR